MADKNYFTLGLTGDPIANEMMRSGWDYGSYIANDAKIYLEKLGYNVKLVKPIPGFGSSALIGSIIAGTKIVNPILKIIIFSYRLLRWGGLKYIRGYIYQRNRKVTIHLSYVSRDRKWTESWDPSKASKKISSMLDAGYHLATYLRNIYPSFNFEQVITFSIKYGNASISLSLNYNQSSQLDLHRYKLIARQTTFEENTEKVFNINMFRIIRRQDYYRQNSFFLKPKRYYLILPSPLLAEIVNKYHILKFRVK